MNPYMSLSISDELLLLAATLCSPFIYLFSIERICTIPSRARFLLKETTLLPPRQRKWRLRKLVRASGKSIKPGLKESLKKKSEIPSLSDLEMAVSEEFGLFELGP